MSSSVANVIFESCTSGTAKCNDAGGVLVGPPLWLLIVFAIVAVAIVVGVVVMVLRRRRARPVDASE